MNTIKLIIIAAFAIENLCYSQNSGDLIKCELKFKNNKLEDDSCFFKIRDDKNLYLLGNYFEDINYSVGYELFRFLVENRKVHTLLIEYSDASAYLINRYLETGNKLYIEEFYKHLNKKLRVLEKSYIQKLYDYYNSLSDSDKFIVRGIDFDSDNLGFMAISEILDNLKLKGKLDDNSISLYFSKTITYNSIKNDAKFILSKMETQDSLYKNLFQNYFYIIKSLIKNMTYISKGNFYTDAYPERERIKYLNMIDLISENKDQKMFGLFGIYHVPKSYVYEWLMYKDWTSFAAMLNTSVYSPFKDKVCTIIPFSVLDTKYYQDEKSSVLDLIEKDNNIFNIEFYDINNKCSVYQEDCEAFDYVICFH